MFKKLIRKIHNFFIKAPLWYTEDEIFEWLKSEAYSPEIAEELTRLWTAGLQKAYAKGYRRGYRASQEVYDFTIKANKLSKAKNIDQAYDAAAEVAEHRAEDLRKSLAFKSNATATEKESINTHIISLKLVAAEIKSLKGL
jgi:uncharacterized protein YwgA